MVHAHTGEIVGACGGGSTDIVWDINVDSTSAGPAHQHAALGRSRGGPTTKLHLVAEGKCRAPCRWLTRRTAPRLRYLGTVTEAVQPLRSLGARWWSSACRS